MDLLSSLALRNYTVSASANASRRKDWTYTSTERLVITKREKDMKKIIIFAMGAMMSAPTIAQDELETTVAADVVSQYIWRGQDLGHVSLQPTLGIGYKGLSLSA